MPKIRDRQFQKTARYVVRVRSDREHSWKHHFRGVFAEVIGYLEFLSKDDKEWFVWAQVDDIVKHCNRYHKGKPYSRAAVLLALEYFRALRIVSGIVERKRFTQGGEMHTYVGRIVTPHHVLCEAVCIRDRFNYCAFKPHKKTPGHKWQGEKQKLAAGKGTGSPVIWYAGPVTEKDWVSRV